MKKTKFFIFGINLALENIGTTFVLSPVRKNIGKRMIFAEMKTLKNFLFTLGLLIGCSLVAFGQTEDKKEPPKKVNPPTINPVDKDKPKDSPTPKTDSKEPKKPENQLAGGGKIKVLVI